MTEQVEQSANDTVISEILELNPELEGIGNYEYGWADSDEAGQSAKRGLDEAVVRDISAKKNEPQWMLDMRLKALKFFERKPMPTWGQIFLTSISITSNTSCVLPKVRLSLGKSFLKIFA